MEERPVTEVAFSQGSYSGIGDVRYVFTDFDEFADAISGLNGRYIPTARSSKQWWIDHMRVGGLRLQQLQVGGASTFAGDGEEHGLTIGIPLTDATTIRIDGTPMAEHSFILIRKDRPLTYSSPDVTQWAGVTVPTWMGESEHFRDAAEWSSAQLSETNVQTQAAPLRRLRLLIASLYSGNEFINIIDPPAIAAAEEEVLLVSAQLLRASSCARPARAGRPPVARERIIARCLEFFRETTGKPMLVSDLCRAVDVSERTLRNIFYEYFGVGPVRFLKARQLQEVRSALSNPLLQNRTVTHIAAQFGVWDLGQFTRHYRALYGETPSQTMRNRRRPATSATAADGSLESLQSWMRYAAACFAQTDNAEL